MAVRRSLQRHNTLRRQTSSNLEVLIDDIIVNIEDTTIPGNLESFKYECNDLEVKRITLLLSIFHDDNNVIPNEIHTKLSVCKDITSLKNEFLCNVIRSYQYYSKYHEAIFSFQELQCKKQKILSLIHNKHYDAQNTKCGIYEFIMNHIKKYNNINVLNDYHFILRNYYEENSDKFEKMYNYICERIGPCDIYKCNYIKQLYDNNNNISSISSINVKEMSVLHLLNQIHCLIFHSFDIHKLKKHNKNMDLFGLNKMIKSKYEKLKDIYKCEYFNSYPKYIANISHRHQLPQLPQLQAGKWSGSAMKSTQKMYKLRKSLHGFAKTLSPRLHHQNSDDANDRKRNDDNKTDELQYLFGRKFCYWSYGKTNNDPFYVKPKEKSLKDELTKRNRLNIWRWNLTYEKAQQFMKCSNCKQLKANKGWEDKYKIHYFDDVSIEHIISLLIYCNSHKLRYHFISTFHPLLDELNEAWLERHRRYAIIGRLLRESVECFGFAFGMKYEHEKVYYGIDTEIMFTKLRVGLFSLSTTTNFAFIFSLMMNINMNPLRERKENGLILSISNAKYPYYFAANWLSLYSSENEKIFFGANELVNIHSILLIDCSSKNTHIFSDYFYFVNAFKILSQIIRGQWSQELYDTKTQKALKKIIEYGLGTECESLLNRDITRRYDTKYQVKNPYDGYDENDEYFDIDDDDELDDIDDDELPQYIRNFFDCYFCQQIDFISIDLGILDSCFGETIRRFFVSHINGGDEIKYNNLISLFPKTKQIKIIGRHEMKWNKYEVKQLTEFLQFDSYLNDILREIIFEFPSQHCLVYEDDIILKNVLNKSKFKQQLVAYGWNVMCSEDEKGIVRFYKENKKKKKKKRKQKNHKKTLSLILTNGQSNGLKKLVKRTAAPSTSLDDSHLQNQRDRPIFFTPKSN